MPTARQVNWARFRVFAVSSVAFLILSVIFYLLSGGTLLQEKATLYLYIPDASGISAGSPVRVDGIDVGKVRSVALSGSMQADRIIRVVMTIERQWMRSIPADSWAQLSADTLIGDKYVDITSGASRAPISPNGTIVYRDNPDIMKRLDLAQFRKQLAEVDAVLTDIEQGRGPLGEFVQGSGMYNEWLKLVRESQVALNAIVARNSKLGAEVYSDERYQRLRQAILAFDQSAARLESGQGEMGALLRDDAKYQQFAASLTSLRQFFAQMGAGPLFESDALYTNWNKQLGSLIHTVDEFNASEPMTRTTFYEDLTGMSRQLQNNLKDFRLDPKKYLRLKVF
jgi:phospholipid/cholesterol/gamma-HCH transport system substrate-binding protein